VQGALVRLDRAVACDPDDPQLRIDRARAHRRRQDTDGARRDLDTAVALSLSAETFFARAEFLEEFGFMEDALHDYAQAVSLRPTAPYYLRRARALFGMRHFARCLVDLDRAAALEPDNVEVYDLRSTVWLFLGKPGRALEEVECALSLNPGLMHLELQRCQLLALEGRADEALRHLEAVPQGEGNDPWIHFIRGFVRCLTRDYGSAVAEFDLAFTGALEHQDHLKAQAALYGVAARILLRADQEETMNNGDGQKCPAAGRLFLCGLGVYPPTTATVQVLDAIRRCDVIFNNIPGAKISEFLGLFCADRRPIEFRYEEDVQRCVDLIFSEVRPGRTVGFVTFGHPMIFGPLARELLARARREGVECAAFSAVSSLDAMLAASGTVLGFSFGAYQVLETTNRGVLDKLGPPNPRLPLLTYFADGTGDAWLADFFRYLLKAYPPQHVGFLFEPRNDLWACAPQRLPLAEIARYAHHRLSQCMLFVPPVEGIGAVGTGGFATPDAEASAAKRASRTASPAQT